MSLSVNTVLAVIVSAIATMLITTFITQACWNYFVPAVLNLPHITFFQAMVLAVGVRSLAGATGISPSFKKE